MANRPPIHDSLSCRFLKSNYFTSYQRRLHLNSERSCCCSSHKLRTTLPASCFHAMHCSLCLSHMLNQNSRTTTSACYVVSELSQFYLLSLADLSSRRVPTFHLPDIYFIFLGSRRSKTFWPPGPLRPGGLSRSPSICMYICAQEMRNEIVNQECWRS